MTRDEIFEKVREAFVDALGVEEDDVTADAKVFDDLGAESLDLLEIVYLLENAFRIKIPRDGIKDASKEGIDPSEYEVDGVLTEKALQKLREVMPEVPESEVEHGLTTNDIPRLFRVETFVNLVVRLLEDKVVEVDEGH
ncbi:MAG: acyl carrier protein [Myxococcales bacterium]|nr:acyl carrier protein [Myxococcales bacterium]